MFTGSGVDACVVIWRAKLHYGMLQCTNNFLCEYSPSRENEKFLDLRLSVHYI